MKNKKLSQICTHFQKKGIETKKPKLTKLDLTKIKKICIYVNI